MNIDKLTPFDTQVLSLMGLAPGKFELNKDGFMHAELGNFGPSLLGFGLQLRCESFSPHYRQLSLRGQLAVRAKHREMLTTAVDTEAVKSEAAMPSTVHVTHAGHRALGSGLSAQMAAMQASLNTGLGAYVQGLSATEVMIRQKEAELARRQMMHTVNPPVAAIAPPSPQDVFYGHTREYLLQNGFSAKDLYELQKTSMGVGEPDMGLIARVMNLS